MIVVSNAHARARCRGLRLVTDAAWRERANARAAGRRTEFSFWRELAQQLVANGGRGAIVFPTLPIKLTRKPKRGAS
jgi:hypothetical protein